MFGGIKSLFPARRLVKRRTTRPDHVREEDEEYGDENSIEEMLPVPQPKHRAAASEDLRGKKHMGGDIGMGGGEIMAMRQEMSEMAKHIEELERRLERSKEQNRVQAEQLQREASQHHLARDLLKARALELRDADAYLSRGNIEEVIAMVESLNQEIHHAAARLVEAFTFEKRPEERRRPSREEETAYEESRKSIGSKILRLLETKDHQEDRSLVKIALQSNIVFCCKRVISSEYFDESRYGRLLTEMCRGIRKAGSLVHEHPACLIFTNFL
jgi:hypothetical protein